MGKNKKLEMICSQCLKDKNIEEVLTMGFDKPRECIICGKICTGEDYNWIWYEPREFLLGLTFVKLPLFMFNKDKSFHFVVPEDKREILE